MDPKLKESKFLTIVLQVLINMAKFLLTLVVLSFVLLIPLQLFIGTPILIADRWSVWSVMEIAFALLIICLSVILTFGHIALTVTDHNHSKRYGPRPSIRSILLALAVTTVCVWLTYLAVFERVEFSPRGGFEIISTPLADAPLSWGYITAVLMATVCALVTAIVHARIMISKRG